MARELIDDGRPALLLTDLFHLDHYGNSAHFPGHAVVLAGYDDESAYVSDTGFEELQRTSLEGLAKARHEQHPFYPLAGHMVSLPAGREVGDLPARSRPRSTRAARRMLEPEMEEVEGLPACARFAEELGPAGPRRRPTGSGARASTTRRSSAGAPAAATSGRSTAASSPRSAGRGRQRWRPRRARSGPARRRPLRRQRARRAGAGGVGRDRGDGRERSRGRDQALGVAGRLGEARKTFGARSPSTLPCFPHITPARRRTVTISRYSASAWPDSLRSVTTITV